MLYDLFHDERYQGHDPGALDGARHGPLMLGAQPVLLRRIDLALRVHEAAQQLDILVVELDRFLLAELTGFSFHIGLSMKHRAWSMELFHVLCYMLYDLIKTGRLRS